MFDTKFVSGPEQNVGEQPQQQVEEVLPIDLELKTLLINYRILVTRREAGVLIGKGGDSITEIREKTNVKAGVSKLIEGCIDRIFTISGAVDDVANSMGLFASNLISNNKSSSSAQTSYNFFPLKPLCPPPTSDEVISFRLMIPNSQMGALIGKQGVRIKAIQETYGVKLVASKDTLFDSTERIVEIQGTPDQITQGMKIISRCLLEDFQTPIGIVYYNPSPRNSHRFSHSAHQPHLQLQLQRVNGKNVVETVGFPLEIVGALIGKRGSRIQEIRRSSGCTISIDPEDNEQGQRVFTLSGSNYNVEKALAMLYNYLDREQLRRSEES